MFNYSLYGHTKYLAQCIVPAPKLFVALSTDVPSLRTLARNRSSTSRQEVAWGRRTNGEAHR